MYFDCRTRNIRIAIKHNNSAHISKFYVIELPRQEYTHDN